MFTKHYLSSHLRLISLASIPYRASAIDIPHNAVFQQHGIAVAGDNTKGDKLNQLYGPYGLFVDNQQSVYVADCFNHRIMKWEKNAKKGQYVVRGNVSGNEATSLNTPTDAVIDEWTHSLIICDYGNRRVVQWPLKNRTSGTTILYNIACRGLTIDKYGSLYAADMERHTVRRYQRGDSAGIVVAGGNGQGSRLDQLNSPTHTCVDRDRTLYVSDNRNHRVMKWIEGAREGFVVAGSGEPGSGLHQLSNPAGIVVDRLGAVYVCDSKNHRIMRWYEGAKAGNIVIRGEEAELKVPIALSFDGDGNLYVAESENHRIQRFNLKLRPIRASVIDIPDNATWDPVPITVVGGNGNSSGMSQLHSPLGLFVDDEQTVYVADYGNNRIMEWKKNSKEGRIIYGGNRQNNQSNHLAGPIDVILDERTHSLIICDYGNRRVVQWPLKNRTSGTTMLYNINCRGLTMDGYGSLYVADFEKQAVRRFSRGDMVGIVVAGGNGQGNRLDQLNGPTHIYVDRDRSLYVSDNGNNRVMKWIEGARKGVVVAGSGEPGSGLHQLSEPAGIVVDQLGTVYVCDSGNDRILRWRKRAKAGSIIIDGKRIVNRIPAGLSFDRDGNIFVAGARNHRVQRFNLKWTPLRASVMDIPDNAIWETHGTIVAGGNGRGNATNQLNVVLNIFVGDEEAVYVADHGNNRIMEWKKNSKEGRIIDGGNTQNNQSNHLAGPIDVILDEETHSLIICDTRNRRVVEWPLPNGINGTTLLQNIVCRGVSIDNYGSLYISDGENHEVRRYSREGTAGIVVAGGNGQGNRLDQLNSPACMFVTRDRTVYVTDFLNHRVMKWIKGAREGIIVAGSKERGSGLHQLSEPGGIVVDQLGTIYVCDSSNHRIMRWYEGAKVGTVIIGGEQARLNLSNGLSFDRHRNIYVADYLNGYVQRFNFEWRPIRGSAIGIRENATWEQSGTIVAGGNRNGSAMNQLANPTGLFVDDEQTIYVVDTLNNRVMKWESNATEGRIIAGGNRQNNQSNYLAGPSDVILDERTHSLIICDLGNRRVVQWSLENDTSGIAILSNIDCVGLTMDEYGSLYVVDLKNHAVGRYPRGNVEGIVVAGGNRQGSRLNQLNEPQYIAIDQDHSVYVSDNGNDRVMKWMEGALEGVVVAGSRERGSGLHQLSNPLGIVVDQLGTIYVCDSSNHRIMRWRNGMNEGELIIGGEELGLLSPLGLSFDRHGNLYIVEYQNHRIQRFNLII